MLDTGYWMLDAGYRIRITVNFEKIKNVINSLFKKKSIVNSKDNSG